MKNFNCIPKEKWNTEQDAQLPKRNSASAAHVSLG